MQIEKPMDGRRVIFTFGGLTVLLAALGFALVLWLRAQPVVQSDQRTMARLLSNAYQKYRYDLNDWPKDPYDAAMNFRSENYGLAERVKKAQTDWGLKAEVIQPASDSPSVKFVFDKPSKLDLTFALYNRNRRKR